VVLLKGRQLLLARESAPLLLSDILVGLFNIIKSSTTTRFDFILSLSPQQQYFQVILSLALLHICHADNISGSHPLSFLDLSNSPHISLLLDPHVPFLNL
jgi:hypothetical protein